MDISQVSFKNHTLTWRLNVLMFGMIAGAISSLCVSSLILLTEKVIDIPVGSFYFIIIDALLHSSSTSVLYVTYGFILHIVPGTLFFRKRVSVCSKLSEDHSKCLSDLVRKNDDRYVW